MFEKKTATSIKSKDDELRQLKIELTKAQAREQALMVERDFWVEQGRSLQNQTQTWQRMYAGLFEQLGRGVVTEESIAENLALAVEELRQPLTSVEAVRAMTAMIRQDTQGEYTAAGLTQKAPSISWSDGE